MGELEEILELTQLPEFQKLQEPIFKQVSKSLQSQHFQVHVVETVREFI